MIRRVLLILLPAAVLARAESPIQDRQMQIEGRVEKKYTIQLDAPQGKDYCQAEIWTEYVQKNTVAKVEGEIENADCGASSGEYTVSIRYRDANGEVHNVEHVESWQRDDEQNVNFEGEYFIGDNVDLIRVRARKIVCICADSGDKANATKGEKR